MKILHFTTTMGGGGAETMLCNVVENMLTSGVDSVVVSTTNSEGDNSLVERISTSANFYNLGVNSLASVAMVRRFWNVLVTEKPDVVQTWMHSSGIVAGTIARICGVKNVVWGIHSRDLLVEEGTPKWREFTMRSLLSSFSKFVPRRIVSCSQVGLETHRDHLGYPNKKLIWIGNGIDTSRFKPDQAERKRWRNQLGIPKDAKVLGFVGRMDPIKDLETFLKAAKQLQTERPDAHIVICGIDEHEIYESVKRSAESLPDHSRVHWLGFQPGVESIYPAFDVIALTSLSEAYPMTLIEAMACGVPCVSTDVGDAKLILGDHGKVVPTRKPSAVLGAVQELLSLSEEDSQTLRENCRESSIARFGLSECAEQYRKLYEELIES